jgi:hypothetical protein
MRDQKTPDQLEQEIAYFAREFHQTTSRARQQRAQAAIARRQRQLDLARRVRLQARPDFSVVQT